MELEVNVVVVVVVVAVGNEQVLKLNVWVLRGGGKEGMQLKFNTGGD